MTTIAGFLSHTLRPVNPTSFEGDDRAWRAYRGQTGAGWLRTDAYNALNFALFYCGVVWTGPGNRNLQAIIGDCGLQDFGPVPGHPSGGHKGGIMADVNYFTLLEDNETHYPLIGGTRWSLFDDDGRLMVSVFDVPRTWAFLRVLSLIFPWGYAMVDTRIASLLRNWGKRIRGIDLGEWLRGDSEPSWNHDKHVHLCLDGSPNWDAELIMTDPANIPIDTGYENPSDTWESLSMVSRVIRESGVTVALDMADNKYLLPGYDELVYRVNGFTPGGPFTDEANDCDDFAFRFIGYISSLHPEWACGIGWTQLHAFNLAVCNDYQLYVIEPQHKTVMPYVAELGPNYKPLRLVVM